MTSLLDAWQRYLTIFRLTSISSSSLSMSASKQVIKNLWKKLKKQSWSIFMSNSSTMKSTMFNYLNFTASLKAFCTCQNDKFYRYGSSLKTWSKPARSPSRAYSSIALPLAINLRKIGLFSCSILLISCLSLSKRGRLVYQYISLKCETNINKKKEMSFKYNLHHIINVDSFEVLVICFSSLLQKSVLSRLGPLSCISFICGRSLNLVLKDFLHVLSDAHLLFWGWQARINLVIWAGWGSYKLNFGVFVL